MPPARFKPAIPASEWQQTYPSDRIAISSSHSTIYSLEFLRAPLNNFGLVTSINWKEESRRREVSGMQQKEGRLTLLVTTCVVIAF